ncbi:hypothetical protein KR222_005135, partial [Zaprionus bogoriensis]
IMFGLRPEARRLFAPMSRLMSGYPGGCPGVNLPFRRGMDNHVRFTIFWTILGTIGFGAPVLVLRHQMLRNVEDAP